MFCKTGESKEDGSPKPVTRYLTPTLRSITAWRESIHIGLPLSLQTGYQVIRGSQGISGEISREPDGFVKEDNTGLR